MKYTVQLNHGCVHIFMQQIPLFYHGLTPITRVIKQYKRMGLYKHAGSPTLLNLHMRGFTITDLPKLNKCVTNHSWSKHTLWLAPTWLRNTILQIQSFLNILLGKNMGLLFQHWSLKEPVLYGHRGNAGLYVFNVFCCLFISFISCKNEFEV